MRQSSSDMPAIALPIPDLPMSPAMGLQPTLTADYAHISSWRRFAVQWDISNNAVALGFFAFTAIFQNLSQDFGMIVVPNAIWYALWFTSCIILAFCIAVTVTRFVIFPNALVNDFRHPRLINFFFLPVIIGGLVILTTPTFLRNIVVFKVGFYVLSIYQLSLALYLYGEWLFGHEPTRFIHPMVFMQVIGFYILSNMGASAHLVEPAWFMFSVGSLFWLLVFITNFQHVAIALHEKSEKPQPTFFLFIAPPAQAALSIIVLELAQAARGTDETSELLNTARAMDWPRLAKSFLDVDLFLYLLIFRLFPTFWTSKFSVSWWAYIFPLSAAAASSIWRYKAENSMLWAVISITLTLVACVAMAIVLSFYSWALWSGRVPNSHRCLAAYDRYFSKNQFPDFNSDSIDKEEDLGMNESADDPDRM